MRDKLGNKLTIKEFFKRWGEGIATLSPLSQIKTQLNSTIIMLIGIIAGFIISLFNLQSFWWGTLILGGAFGNTFMQFVALYQKKRLLEGFNQEPVNLTEIMDKIDKEQVEEVKNDILPYPKG